MSSHADTIRVALKSFMLGEGNSAIERSALTALDALELALKDAEARCTALENQLQQMRESYARYIERSATLDFLD